MTLTVHPLCLAEALGDTSILAFGLTPGTKKWSPCTGYLILGGEKVILVDAGVRESLAQSSEAFRIEPEHELSANLARHGITADEVEGVIFTHLHIDHSGLADKFPNAVLYVQRRELQYAAAPMFPVRFYDRIDIAKFVDPLFGQIEFLEGETEIIPGVRCIPTGGHTPGHQMVYVDVPSGTAIITGDNVYLADVAMRDGTPPGYIVDLADTLAAIARIRRDGDHVLPMHDPMVYERYPNGVA
jgi:N-acyl homoserine lactone hydrolase